jgi:hypothetical protein
MAQFPDFLGIGAQRAGTTWLHAMLSLHNEIWLPHLKEVHYFDRKFPISVNRQGAADGPGKGILSRHFSAKWRRLDIARVRERLRLRRIGDFAWEARYLFGRWDDDWYASLFRGAGGRTMGEITPAYSCLGDRAIDHVHHLMPEARLILLLRDPVERAWSHAKMDLTRASRRRPEEVGDDEFRRHFAGAASRARGDYLGTIGRWLTKYPANQLFIGFYDEIVEKPGDLLSRLFRFLEVSALPDAIPAGLRNRVNPTRDVPIPPHLHAQLAALYVDDLGVLAERYGPFPGLWLEKAEQALSSLPGGQRAAWSASASAESGRNQAV